MNINRNCVASLVRAFRRATSYEGAWCLSCTRQVYEDITSFSFMNSETSLYLSYGAPIFNSSYQRSPIMTSAYSEPLRSWCFLRLDTYPNSLYCLDSMYIGRRDGRALLQFGTDTRASSHILD